MESHFDSDYGRRSIDPSMAVRVFFILFRTHSLFASSVFFHSFRHYRAYGVQNTFRYSILWIVFVSGLTACSVQPLRSPVSDSQDSTAAQTEPVAAPVAKSVTQRRSRSVLSLLELRRRNVVMQEWDLSCGAAALTTLLRYQHGLDLTEKEVASSLIKREEYINNPDLLRIKQGFSLLDLKRYVDRLGYPGNGYGRLDLNNLIKLAPLLVPVRLEGYNHFVVFRGVAGSRVLLADPAWGNRIMSQKKFLDAWMDLPKLGHVGFSVTSASPGMHANLLAPTELDFVMLQ